MGGGLEKSSLISEFESEKTSSDDDERENSQVHG